MTVLPVPPHFDPRRVGEVWRVPYEERAREAEVWAREHRIAPAVDDEMRVCLVAVDVQNTFCVPGFELFVRGRSGTGAVDDNRRLCEFVYRNLGSITCIVPTLDTHTPLQIFHALFLIDDEGRRPEPYTLVSAEDVERGVWKADPDSAQALGFDADYLQEHLRHYTRALEEGGKYNLTVWPYHALLGGIGHALVSAVEEAVFFHSIARRVRPDFHVKGNEPLTEHYSLLGPEVLEDHDGRAIGSRNELLIEQLLDYDAVLIAGQAKSHCVAWTIDDLLTGIAARDRSLAEKVYLLEDCSSPVVVPGVVDYSDEADAAFERFAAAGMHVVRSTVPLSSWLETQPTTV
jgi:nicotinamidase-related amidase